MAGLSEKQQTLVLWLSMILLLATAMVLSVRTPASLPEASEYEKKTETSRVAPRDLAEWRDEYAAGVDAIGRNDGVTAVRNLSSFDFGDRAVEEYRLYNLSTAYQLQGDQHSARITLARLWRRKPALIYRDDVAFNLAALYVSSGRYREASDVYGVLATKGGSPSVEAAARTEFIESKFYMNDPGGMILAARKLLVENPGEAPSAQGSAILRGFAGEQSASPPPLTATERLRRAENLLRDKNPVAAASELKMLGRVPLPSSLSNEARMYEGIALTRLSRYADSDRVLTPLFDAEYRFAVPALVHSSRNNRVMAASINPDKVRVVEERKRVGTVKVRVKGKKKLVSKPKFQTVRRNVKYVDKALLIRKEGYDRAYVERLRDLLQIPSDDATRQEVLLQLIARAAAKNQDEYLSELIPQLVKIDPLSDTGLQRFWDKGWAAWQRGDLTAAQKSFEYIRKTYKNPNTRRQSQYWYARTIERQGLKKEAALIYAQLAASPYEDLYALFAEKRGAIRPANVGPNPMNAKVDWPAVVEPVVPEDLRLAFELNMIGARRDARSEVQKNQNLKNQKVADAIMADLYFAAGSMDLANRFVRRAYPELATVEQNSVPKHFLKMYYPLRYEETIRKHAAERGLDPHLVMALIRQESAFNVTARSHVGATGLMQLMPATARELGAKHFTLFSESRLTNPDVNVKLGTIYLRQVIDSLDGNVELALAGYNGGPNRVKRLRREKPRQPLDEFVESFPFAETRNYVKRITLLRASYKRFYS